MKDLLMILSDVMTIDHIIEEMKKAILKWEEDSSEENRRHIEIYAMMFLSKAAASTCKGGMKELIKQHEQMDMVKKLIIPESES